MNQDGWPVTAVYEYLGSQISPTGYSLSDMAGTYELVNHGTDASTANVGMLATQRVSLNPDGTITGAYNGTWTYQSGTYYCQMTINNVVYKGVFFKQKDESSVHNEVMTFSLIGANNESIWGSQIAPYLDNVEGTFYVKNAFSNLYLDVADGSAADGANVQQWSYNGFQAQQFQIVSDGDGYYHILTGASNFTKALNVDNNLTADGTNINQYQYTGAANQQFQIQKQADGTYAILSRNTNGLSGLDVYNWSDQPGGNVNLWNYWGGDCQKWLLEPV